MAAARCSCGIAAIWESGRSRARLQEGRPQIHAAWREAAWQLGAGAHAQRPQRRQAHQLAADQASRRICQGGQGQRHSGEDQSVASGRSMEQIAAGKGKAPKPFMLAKARPRQGRCGLGFQPRRGRRGAREDRRSAAQAAPARRRRSKAASKVAAMPDFVAPQLCTLVERPPAGEGWCHEIKFDGYRVQLRVEDGEAALKTRKGLDWTEKFQGHRQSRQRAAGCDDRRRDRRARPQRRAGFLGAAGGALRRQDRQSRSFLRSICCLPMARIFARCRWASARRG